MSTPLTPVNTKTPANSPITPPLDIRRFPAPVNMNGQTRTYIQTNTLNLNPLPDLFSPTFNRLTTTHSQNLVPSRVNYLTPPNSLQANENVLHNSLLLLPTTRRAPIPQNLEGQTNLSDITNSQNRSSYSLVFNTNDEIKEHEEVTSSNHILNQGPPRSAPIPIPKIIPSSKTHNQRIQALFGQVHGSNKKEMREEIDR